MMMIAYPLSPARQCLVDLAMGYVGCGVTHDRERYLDLVSGPDDLDPAMQLELAHDSGCALVQRGLLRAAGLAHPLLEARYRTGHAMADLEQIGRDAGAWVEARHRAGALPLPGDVVVCDSNTGGHSYLVIEVWQSAGRLCELVSVDGGQKDSSGGQLISRCRRHWDAQGLGIVDRGYHERAVRGWIDVERLPWLPLRECC